MSADAFPHEITPKLDGVLTLDALHKRCRNGVIPVYLYGSDRMCSYVIAENRVVVRVSSVGDANRDMYKSRVLYVSRFKEVKRLGPPGHFTGLKHCLTL